MEKQRAKLLVAVSASIAVVAVAYSLMLATCCIVASSLRKSLS